MLRAIELENFKAFGTRTRIEFAPITLIFGENSAGKSSILQSLGLLKQTRESREHGALLLPRSETGIVDLGSFQELLFDHDLGRQLVIRVDLDFVPRRTGQAVPRGEGDEPAAFLGVELAFLRRSEKDEVSLSHMQFYSQALSQPVARFESMELTKDERRSLFLEYYPAIHARRPLRMSEFRMARCTHVTDDENYWFTLYDKCKRLTPRILENLELSLKNGEQVTQQDTLFNEDALDVPDHTSRINNAVNFYRSDFTISQFINRMRNAELGTRVALDGFVAQPSRSWAADSLPEFGVIRKPGMFRIMRERMSFNVRTLAFDAGHLLESFLESLYPMGPYRRPPERWYIFTGTNPQDVGYRGDLLPSLLYRRPEVVQQTNKWLERLQIGYRLDVRPIGERTRDLFEVRLVDTRRNRDVDVALSDVGYGISQVLPFVVQSLASERQIITIEQPEVHVHPRLQADLGDLLAEEIGEPRFHRFIIETHSEHLALRLQRRVREKKLSPSDISVLFVSRGPGGATVQPLRLDDEGDFIDNFPGGFFPERLRELR